MKSSSNKLRRFEALLTLLITKEFTKDILEYSLVRELVSIIYTIRRASFAISRRSKSNEANITKANNPG